MLQVRIINPDGSDPVILHKAENKSYFKAVDIADEGISFEIAKNSDKANVINPDNSGYKKFWEVWNTKTNQRMNYGPITTITENGPNWKVDGRGRSALLDNFIESIKTFYYPLDTLIDDLRFENVAIQPRTTTLVNGLTDEHPEIFGLASADERYDGLSKKTKDNVIDDNTGLFKVGKIEPTNTFFTTDSYWSGGTETGAHIVDLGGIYNISKISLVLPWWGGNVKVSDRTYDFSLSYATNTVSGVIIQPPLPREQFLGIVSTDDVIGRRALSSFTEIYRSPNNNKLATNAAEPYQFYIGTTLSGTSLAYRTFYIGQEYPGPIQARYIRTNIRDVHAWYGHIFDDAGTHDGYDFQCDPAYAAGQDSYFGSRKGVMHNKEINDRKLEPANDCFASIVELGAYQEIIPRDNIQALALQRIDNNNLQITYSHTPDSTETKTTTNGYRKFEPGGFFRKFTLDYSGATTSYTKFYGSDCTNCFPDGFNFMIMDQNNSLLYGTDNTSGSDVAIKAPAYTSRLTMKGASNATVKYVDAWPSVTDPFSWNSTYSYTEIANDWATVHFRGQSFKWYATIPENKTGATVRVEIRHKLPIGRKPFPPYAWITDVWTPWVTLENSLQLPSAVAAELVYEITYESGILEAERVYEIRITNLDGNYCSIDAFEGYWSGSMTTYNEDNHRIVLNDLNHFEQIYDKRFSAGSMYKISKPSRMQFVFEGDRAIIYSAKGRNHGKMRIFLFKLGQNGSVLDDDNAETNKIDIDPYDGTYYLTVNLATSKRGNEIPQAIVFDSNDWFPGGLPWDRYAIGVYLASEDIETYSTRDTAQFDNFVARCKECKPATGDLISVTKPIFFDGIAVHELLGVSVSFENETHLDILKSVSEAVQAEPDITEEGLLFKPRLGTDTEIILREGHNTVVNYNIVNDVSHVASMLVSNGSDIDGLPLFTITEDKRTREDLGRTVMRKEDFRNVADYFQLIGLSRTSLRKRKAPEKRITVTHIADDFSLNVGDSYILYTKKMGAIRVRILRLSILESSGSGTSYEMECTRWPQII